MLTAKPESVRPMRDRQRVGGLCKSCLVVPGWIATPVASRDRDDKSQFPAWIALNSGFDVPGSCGRNGSR